MIRRRRYSFVVTDPSGEPNRRIDVTAYGRSQAIAYLSRAGYTDIKAWEPKVTWSLDKEAAIALGRKMGIKGPITIRLSQARLPAGVCHTNFIPLHHRIVLSVLSPDPERTIRHELAHALHNEQRLAAANGDVFVAVANCKHERQIHGYYDSPSERFARSYEDYRLDLSVTTSSEAAVRRSKPFGPINKAATRLTLLRAVDALLARLRGCLR